MMQTAAPERSSLSENQRPLASFQLPDWKYAFVVPVTVVERFFAPLITLTLRLATGATDVIEGTSWPSASASCRRNGLALPDAPPGPRRWPGITLSMLLPMVAMSAVTCAVAPLPSVTMMMTDATPMMIPSAVNDDRRTFLRISRSARMMALISISGLPWTVLRSLRQFVRRSRRGHHETGSCARRRQPYRARASP